jgi:hypothetical protein
MHYSITSSEPAWSVGGGFIVAFGLAVRTASVLHRPRHHYRQIAVSVTRITSVRSVCLYFLNM